MVQLRKNTNRIPKVNAKIQQGLGMILHDLLGSGPGLVTVSKVETSKDLKWAKVWVSIFGGDDEKILKLLNSRIFEIQGRLNDQFSTKILPRLQFVLDTSPRYVQHIDELIKKIHEESNKDAPHD